MIGAIYIVVVEGIFGSIDFVIREATVIYHIRCWPSDGST